MPPLDLQRLDPDREGSLERFAAQIQELVLWLRDEGHILSSIDQHFVEQWWERGYPLETVLSTLRARGERLKGRKNPPRGLPLRAMKRWVEKDGDRACQAQAGRHPDATKAKSDQSLEDTEGESGGAPLQRLALDIDMALLNPSSPEHRGTLELVRAQLEDLSGRQLPPAELFAELLALGRRYYDRALDLLSADNRRERTEVISASLGEAAARMDPAALDATVSELLRRQLRATDPLFDPQRYWSDE